MYVPASRQLARYLLLPTLHLLSLSERNNFTLLRLSNRVRSNISSFCIIRRAKKKKKRKKMRSMEVCARKSSRLQIIIFTAINTMIEPRENPDFRLSWTLCFLRRSPGICVPAFGKETFDYCSNYGFVSGMVYDNVVTSFTEVERTTTGSVSAQRRVILTNWWFESYDERTHWRAMSWLVTRFRMIFVA